MRAPICQDHILLLPEACRRACPAPNKRVALSGRPWLPATPASASNLGPLSEQLSVGRDIDDAGQIVGYGTNAGGVAHSFLPQRDGRLTVSAFCCCSSVGRFYHGWGAPTMGGIWWRQRGAQSGPACDGRGLVLCWYAPHAILGAGG